MYISPFLIVIFFPFISPSYGDVFDLCTCFVVAIIISATSIVWFFRVIADLEANTTIIIFRNVMYVVYVWYNVVWCGIVKSELNSWQVEGQVKRWQLHG